MNQEKVFFKFFFRNITFKNRIEAGKIFYKKSCKKYRIALLIIMMFLFIDQILNSIYRYDLSAYYAIIMYFSDVRWLILDCLILIIIYKIVEIKLCIRYIIDYLKNSKIIKNISHEIIFYESYYTVIRRFTPNIYEEYIIHYSDIDKYFTSSNSIIIKSNTIGHISPVIPKDSIENVDDFINFLNKKISK